MAFKFATKKVQTKELFFKKKPPLEFDKNEPYNFISTLEYHKFTTQKCVELVLETGR